MVTNYMLSSYNTATIAYASYYPRYIGFPACPQPATPPLCKKTINSLSNDDLVGILVEFTTLYPELTTAGIQMPQLVMIAKQLACLYPDYTCVDDDCSKQVFFLLLAHRLTADTQEFTQGTLSSASVGDSSVSYDNTAVNTYQNNPFYLWLTKSKHGQLLLTLLKRSAIVIV